MNRNRCQCYTCKPGWCLGSRDYEIEREGQVIRVCGNCTLPSDRYIGAVRANGRAVLEEWMTILNSRKD